MRGLCVSAALALAGCAQPLLHLDHPLAGRIWDVRAGAYVTAETVWQRATAARHVLIGETHDNPEHHRLQRLALEAIAASGQRRMLAMEQFDSEHQAAIDAAQAAQADAERVADAGRFDREGWNWPLYRQLVEFAVARGWPLVAANLSRAELRRVVADPALLAALPAATPELIAALERDMIEGHCGHRPEAKTLAGMVNGQRARDARMAEVLLRAPQGGTVLVAGNGHVRRDRGVPLYLPADTLVIGIVEVSPDARAPGEYLERELSGVANYDYVWFTPRAARDDPCLRFKR